MSFAFLKKVLSSFFHYQTYLDGSKNPLESRGMGDFSLPTLFAFNMDITVSPTQF